MAQISKGTTFTNGDQVTGALLNQLVDSSTLLVGAITDQPSITANTLEVTDSTIVNDAGTLKEATIGDILNSNLPVTTSSITGGSGVDIVVAPAVGQKFDVNGAFESTTSNTTGNATIGGTLVVTGGSTLTGNVIADNGFTSNGVANFAGALQVNGTVGYVLTEVVEETIAVNITTQGALDTINTYFTSASYTKPVDEVWVIEVCANITHNSGSYLGVRLKQSSTSSIIDGDFFVDFVDTARPNRMNRFHAKGVISSATTFTSTFVIEASLYGGGTHGIGHTNYSSALAGVLTTFNIAPSVFRIYKYKTA
jgi:hypothetical protein